MNLKLIMARPQLTLSFFYIFFSLMLNIIDFFIFLAVCKVIIDFELCWILLVSLIRSILSQKWWFTAVMTWTRTVINHYFLIVSFRFRLELRRLVFLLILFKHILIIYLIMTWPRNIFYLEYLSDALWKLSFFLLLLLLFTY